ncbi:MAG: hypothetical protein AB8G16_05690 [Gammaproteobacteria bacterium]
MPPDALRLTESALATRTLQTREFYDTSEVQILSASVGVLQDLGYAIDEIEKPLGVLSASKRADATNQGQVVGRVALDLASCFFTFLVACDNENYKKTDDVQDIRLTLVVLPAAGSATDHTVRVTMQRIVWDRDGRISNQATIDEAAVYQAFFSKLDKSVILERGDT